MGRFGRAMTADIWRCGEVPFGIKGSSFGESSVRALFSSVLHVDVRSHGDGAEFVGLMDNVLSILAVAP